VRILRQHIEKLGYKRNFVIYDESEQLGAIKKILAHLKGEKVDPSAVLAMLSRLRNAGDGAWKFQDELSFALAQHIRGKYESALHACNAVDFDDLILLTLRLFAEHPDALAACRERYRYVMVDEYQDTNGAQFKLVHSLTSEHRNLCVVGDDDQSIYGWRGAELTHLLEMERHYPEVKVVKLEQNYRSTNTILRAANAVIQRNVQRRGKKLWSDKGEGTKIQLHTFENDEAEARGIVELIEHARVIQRIPWSQQAILFRTNMQSRPLETELRKASVRYHLIGGKSFFDRREVRDFLAYLKTLINPHDDVSLLRIANVPARGMSDAIMERLLAASQERKCSVYAVLTNPVVVASFQAKARANIEAFAHLLAHWRQRLADPAPASQAGALRAWAGELLKASGYLEDLKRSEKTPEAAETRIRSLTELMDSLDGEEPAGKPLSERLENFLEQITLDNDREDEEEKAGEAVTLITMHSCKGLEFPHVYIVGLEEGLLPHTRSKEEGTLDEERRLFYVALTRAMRSLTISYCVSRRKFGSAVHCHPSMFLRELPPELVEDGEAKSKAPVSVEAGRSIFAQLKESLG
jgi:superfamily I DNA/RNA helicase